MDDAERRGRFITLEGPEGSGKTTQARRLKKRLEAAGCTVVYTREPGGTALGEALRDLLQGHQTSEPIHSRAEVFLFAASRAQLAACVIRPALLRGEWVICDRFFDSSVAYQGYGRGFDPERINDINQWAVEGAVPDLTLLLDLDVEEGFRRILERGAGQAGPLDRIEQEERAFHIRVREGYLQWAARWPERFRILDAGREEEAVTQAVWEAVQHVCGL